MTCRCWYLECGKIKELDFLDFFIYSYICMVNFRRKEVGHEIREKNTTLY